MSPQPQLIVPSITAVPTAFITSLAAKAPWMPPTRPHWTLTTTTVPAVVTSTVAAATTSTTATGKIHSKAKYIVPIAVVLIIIAGFLLFLALEIYHTRRQARRTTAKIQHLQWWSQRQGQGPSHAYGSDEDGGPGVRRGARTRTGDVALDELPRYADIIGPKATRYGGPVVPPAYHSMIGGERRYFGSV
ncbi:hypothetical protein LTR05_002602 [Lithohypha guttulata]|uniref:Transmembrane protein n=1 Tax=Lithohypha guttulata TaxID=1690604 RepID=A0AAN7T571_9EURO|nr:hypothetical protein LTR05_002602 [Lithohypha guttulata]